MPRGMGLDPYKHVFLSSHFFQTYFFILTTSHTGVLCSPSCIRCVNAMLMDYTLCILYNYLNLFYYYIIIISFFVIIIIKCCSIHV